MCYTIGTAREKIEWLEGKDLPPYPLAVVEIKPGLSSLLQE